MLSCYDRVIVQGTLAKASRSFASADAAAFFLRRWGGPTEPEQPLEPARNAAQRLRPSLVSYHRTASHHHNPLIRNHADRAHDMLLGSAH